MNVWKLFATLPYYSNELTDSNEYGFDILINAELKLELNNQGRLCVSAHCERTYYSGADVIRNKVASTFAIAKAAK